MASIPIGLFPTLLLITLPTSVLHPASTLLHASLVSSLNSFEPRNSQTRPLQNPLRACVNPSQEPATHYHESTPEAASSVNKPLRRSRNINLLLHGRAAIAEFRL
ncbi:hypothetical protein BJX99DRAFT_263972 [Aspergillus californicus]